MESCNYQEEKEEDYYLKYLHDADDWQKQLIYCKDFYSKEKKKEHGILIDIIKLKETGNSSNNSNTKLYSNTNLNKRNSIKNSSEIDNIVVGDNGGADSTCHCIAM